MHRGACNNYHLAEGVDGSDYFMTMSTKTSVRVGGKFVQPRNRGLDSSTKKIMGFSQNHDQTRLLEVGGRISVRISSRISWSREKTRMP